MLYFDAAGLNLPSRVWYLRHPKAEDKLPEDQRIWSINKSRSRCSGKFVISYDPDDCIVIYHGDHANPNSLGNLEARLLDHFQQSPGVPFEIAELALQFSSSEAHIRRLVKRLWRQGHVLEEVREIQANNGRGGKSRKKVFISPNLDDQVIKTQVGQGSLSPDHPFRDTGDQKNGSYIPQTDDQVLPTQSEQGQKAPDHRIPRTHNPAAHYFTTPLQPGDWVEILTGCFIGRQVEVMGIPPDKTGWVEVKGKGWAITQQYQRSNLRLIRRTAA